jgi:hypothetical protein
LYQSSTLQRPPESNNSLINGRVLIEKFGIKSIADIEAMMGVIINCIITPAGGLSGGFLRFSYFELLGVYSIREEYCCQTTLILHCTTLTGQNDIQVIIGLDMLQLAHAREKSPLLNDIIIQAGRGGSSPVMSICSFGGTLCSLATGTKYQEY